MPHKAGPLYCNGHRAVDAFNIVAQFFMAHLAVLKVHSLVITALRMSLLCKDRIVLHKKCWLSSPPPSLHPAWWGAVGASRREAL